MHSKLLLSSWVVALSLGLAACGSDDNSPAADPGSPDQPGGDGGNPPSELTTFSVSLSAPDALISLQRMRGHQGGLLSQLLPRAHAVDASDIDAGNIALVVVDANGVVLERVTLTADNLRFDEAAGVWEISIDGDPRLDCVVVFDLSEEIVISVGQPLPDNTLYAPTTALNVDVDLASTSAYQQLLDSIEADLSFADLGLDPTDADAVAQVEALVNQVQQDFDQLLSDGNISLDGFTDIDDLLAAVEQVVDEVVSAAVADITTAANSELAAEFAEGGAGVTWFDSWVYDAELVQLVGMDYGILSPTADSYAELDEAQGQWGELMAYEPGSLDGNLVLTPQGWQLSADNWQLLSVNDDGSVTFSDRAVAVSYLLTPQLSVDLQGRGIMEFLSVRPQTQVLSHLVDETATFGDGDLGYRVTDAVTEAHYELFADGGDTVPVTLLNDNLEPTNASALSSLLVAEGSDSLAGAVVVDSEAGETLVVKLVDDDSKTAEFYRIQWASGASDKVASSVWSYQTPAGLADGESLILLELPASYQPALAFAPRLTSMIAAEYDGSVLMGMRYSPQLDAETSWVYNQSGGEAVLAAIDFAYLDQYQVTSDNACVLESGYEDDAYDGFGGPVSSFHSIRAFERVVSLCRQHSESAMAFTEAMVAGKTLTLFDDEQVLLNADGTGQWQDEDEQFAIGWSITDAGYLRLALSELTESGDSGSSYTFSDEELLAIVASDGGVLDVRGFYRNSLWQQIGPYEGDEPEIGANQGEIYSTVVSISD
ncbi:hypothetical protein [Ferrimonas sp. SCSIO 43195]|uniref:hypothetical protein n=1 Tax=Ferrimonas sp. SCSIO 43195 TaxID=2822844 RepID=UPI0020750C92|nr:hypothetical protein [Ferrimonas sp. SCSIO 43195]USD36036.1 hypothetical protein J8Z22_13415 [Ferrimonas sp. SCSIO 43195]